MNVETEEKYFYVMASGGLYSLYFIFFVREPKMTFNTDGVKEITRSMNCEWIHVLHIFMTEHK